MENTLNPVRNPAPNPVLKPINSSPAVPKMKNMTLALISVVVVLAGIGTGYLLSGVKGKTTGPSVSNSIVTNENEAGIKDESKFSTTADGVLEAGGIGGEGTHHLIRGSGPSQYAYLTSSSVDLERFVGKKVQVWGETMSGKKAGWLIDVGKIKVTE